MKCTRRNLHSEINKSMPKGGKKQKTKENEMPQHSQSSQVSHEENNNKHLFNLYFPSGGFPYPTINDRDLLDYLLEGNRMEKPNNCTDEM